MVAPTLDGFFHGKSPKTLGLFQHFISEFQRISPVTIHPAKTMIGIATPRKRIAYVTRVGKDFILVAFMFEQAYSDNLCFERIAEVPGETPPSPGLRRTKQFNHYFRMQSKEDVNKEVIKFMKLAVELGS